MRIGLVDLDTSHPVMFSQILRSMPGVEIVACWDGGTVYPAGYAAQFAREHQVPHACETLDEMVDLVDVAFIHGCNWDTHLERARPFLAAGKPVFIDKPLVGNLREVQELQALAKLGANIIGGSSLRHADEVKAFHAAQEGRRPLNAFVSTGVDSYNYGIHGIELALNVMGAGVRSARYLGASDQTDLFHVAYGDGRHILLQLVAPGHHFHATVTTTTGIETININAAGLYAPMLQAAVAHFRGEAPYPISLDELLEAVKVGLACRRSRVTGQTVWLDDLRADDPGFDGAAFGAAYRMQKLKG